MKRFVVATIPFLVAGITNAAGAATQPALDEPPVTLNSLLDPPSTANTGVTDLRAQMLTDAGKTVGFRGGMVARARILRTALRARAESLDQMFQFSTLISKDGVLPPVIVQARDVTSFSSGQIRTASRVYNIEKKERFVSVPPTWRDYLFVGLPFNQGVDLPGFAARPQNSSEEVIWRDAVRKGWYEGEQQADSILAANFERLTRDYTGMLLYSTFIQQGQINTTKVASSYQSVTGNDDKLVIGDTLHRITTTATFETDPNKWRPVVTSPPADDPKKPAVTGVPSLTNSPNAPSSSASVSSSIGARAIRAGANGSVQILFDPSGAERISVSSTKGATIPAAWDESHRIMTFEAPDHFYLSNGASKLEIARIIKAVYHFAPANDAHLQSVFDDHGKTYFKFAADTRKISVVDNDGRGKGEQKGHYYMYDGVRSEYLVTVDGVTIDVGRSEDVRFYAREVRQ